MLDVLGIFLSGVMVLFIIIRAVQLDRTLPWFGEAQPEPGETAAPSGRSPQRTIMARAAQPWTALKRPVRPRRVRR